MGLHRRKGSPFWWYSFTIERDRYRGSTGEVSKSAARRVEDEARTRARAERVGGKQLSRHTLDEALGRYWRDHARYLASAPTIDAQWPNLLRLIGASKFLDEIDDAAVAQYVSDRRREPNSRYKPGNAKPLANATINREIALLRSVIERARDAWKWRTAEINWKIHKLQEPERKQRILSQDEIDRVIAEAAPHLKPMIRFSLLTGTRLANTVGLDWSQVDLGARQIVFRVKSSRPGRKRLEIPISDALFALLVSLGPRSEGRVFLVDGRPIANPRTAWKAALRRAGIEADVRWHDMRHTAGTYMTRAGVPLQVVQELLGHADISTTRRYVEVDGEQQREAMDALGAALETGKPRLWEVK